MICRLSLSFLFLLVSSNFSFADYILAPEGTYENATSCTITYYRQFSCGSNNFKNEYINCGSETKDIPQKAGNLAEFYQDLTETLEDANIFEEPKCLDGPRNGDCPSEGVTCNFKLNGTEPRQTSAASSLVPPFDGVREWLGSWF